MSLVRLLACCLFLAVAASAALGGQLIWQEDFSGAFIERDWIYNNSGPNTATGYDGQPWVCRLQDDYPVHKQCVNYGEPIYAAFDTYNWMSYTNTHAGKPACFKAALPPDWTAAFDIWAHYDPSVTWQSGRGKMGFGPYIGPHSQSPGNPCLNAWSSHGQMRIVSPLIATGPGVYTLNWKIGVWNGNTEDPEMQYKWSDWCQWGFGYTNWGVWDGDPMTTPPYRSELASKIAIPNFWVWQKDPFHDSDPDGVIDGRPNLPHPPGEEPGMWHEFTRKFAFGLAPDHSPYAPDFYDYGQPPGYFVGFNVGHSHDEHPSTSGNWRWATIVNIDDIVLVKEDPVSVATARQMAPNSLVELENMVLTNTLQPNFDLGRFYVDLFFEAEDRSGGIMLRVNWPNYDRLWDEYYGWHVEPGQVFNIVAAVHYSTAGTVYLGGWLQGSRLPAVFGDRLDIVDIKPVGLNSRDLAGSPATNGLSNDGMLVTVCGKVNNVVVFDPGEFYLDDGGGLTAGEPYMGAGVIATGVKIDLARFEDENWIWEPYMLPTDGKHAAVTGTLAVKLHPDGQTLVRTVYPRYPEDIRVLN